MKLKKLLAAVTAAALAVSTMAVTSFTASAADTVETLVDNQDITWTQKNEGGWWSGDQSISLSKVSFENLGDFITNGEISATWTSMEVKLGEEDVTANSQFMLKLSSKNGEKTNYDGAYAGNGTATSLNLVGANIGKESAETSTELAFSYAVGPSGYDTKIGDILNVSIKGLTITAKTSKAASEDDDLPKNEWFKNEYGSDAYICTNGNAPEEAFFVDVEALLDEGKTLADVSKITAIYAVSSINEAEQGVSGCFGVVHDVGGTNDWYDDIYSEWEWLASDSTAEEGKDCVIECADGLLDTDECQFQIDTMKANNVLVVDFQIDYKDEGGDEPPVDDKSVTGSETLTGSNWWAEKSLTVAELLGDLDKTKTTITFTSDDDIIVGYKSKTVVDESADDPNWKQNTPAKSVVISSSDIDFDNFMLKVCVSRNDDKEVTINWIAKEGSAPVEPEKPAEPTSKVLWTGETTVSWAPSVVNIPASELASIKAGDTIKITFTPDDNAQFKFMTNGEGWPVLSDSSKNDSTFSEEWGTVSLSASPYEFVIAEADVEKLKSDGMNIGGQNATVTKVELVTASGTTKPDDPKPDDPKPDDPKPDNTITTPSDRVTYPVVIPFGYTPATDEDITNAVSSTAEGDTASVNLTSNTRVDKAVLDTIAGKDITVEFKLKGGAKWVINGKNVEKAKKVDLGVRLRSKAIPAEKISTVAGDNRTVQFSLRHNGDLGFTGALIIPFSSAYNGKFANLYYNNTAKDELEFVGSSKISAGQASFVFTHASDYVVVIDDEAYGEDVSSAAGVYETSEATAAPYVAAVAVIAVLGVAAVVIKKRLAK